MGIKERTSREKPCIFCGDAGYDMRVTYFENGIEETVHWCHKTHAQKGDITVVGTDTFICIASAKQIEIGEFDLWKKYLPKEEWLRQRKEKGAFFTNRLYAPKISRNTGEPIKAALIAGEEPVLPNKQLHDIYSFLLSLLTLEEKHYLTLSKEWNNPIHQNLTKDLLNRYPIKSLPPVDKARFQTADTFENPFRKHVVAKLLKEFGNLRGVPGFYLQSGSYYDAKPEKERWTFSGKEGIIFPCYDVDGNLYRIRYRDEYPDLELKEGIHQPFLGEHGAFHHYYNKEGKHVWSFHPKEGIPAIVYGEGQNQIALNEKGMPSLMGKVGGKYKNFSSYHEKEVNGKPVNAMLSGSRSGSPYSLYYKEGQSFLVVLGTEGEKKGMVSNYIKGFPTISLPGVSCYHGLFNKEENQKSVIELLKERGMKYFILCYDADKHENNNVLKAEENFIKELKAAGVIPLIGEWKGKFQKGIDDILLMGLDISIRQA